MLIINPVKPFYIDKKNKNIRMGNFQDTGKEIDYDNENILNIFDNLNEPIEMEKLIELVHNSTNVDEESIRGAIEYLISENFIVDNDDYEKIINADNYSRMNLYFSMFTNSFEDRTKLFKDKNILILGLGGVGSNVSFMLYRSGFNNFTLVDCDKVESSNLIRQFPYQIKDVGLFKTEVLKKKLLNNNSKIFTKNIKILKKEDIEEEIRKTDFVLCTLDKPSRVIRRLINSVCVKYKKPVLFAGFAEHTAMVGPLVVPYKTACLVCNDKEFKEKPLNNVKVVPSYGPLCSMISSIATNEIINYFAHFSENNLYGKTLMFNMKTYESTIIKWAKYEKCLECGDNANK